MNGWAVGECSSPTLQPTRRLPAPEPASLPSVCPPPPHPAAVPVCIFAFDLLYRDGQSLAGLPLAERRSQLRQAFPATRPGRFVLAQGQEYPGGGAAANDGGRVAPGAAGERLAEAPGGAQQQEGQHSGDIGEDVAAAADAAQAGQGSAALAGRAWEAGEAGGAAAAGDSALEERLQESLLEAFAAGAGAQRMPRVGCGWVGRRLGGGHRVWL